MPQTVPMSEREWFVLFAICVAGKSAKQTQAKLNEYLNFGFSSPFDTVRLDIANNSLLPYLKAVKMGQYKRIEKAFREVVKLDVTKDLTVEKLEAIPGIGPKTARFIVLYTDPDSQCVPLDTHILKYLRSKGFDAHKSTPPAGKKYRWFEEQFKACAIAAGKTVRELDTEVWQRYAKR
jgi:thermostable 8-oxoguanine DNA glycosylase